MPSFPRVVIGNLILIVVGLLLLNKTEVILKGCSSGSSIFLVVAFIKQTTGKMEDAEQRPLSMTLIFINGESG